jgi:hypothetical protein
LVAFGPSGLARALWTGVFFRRRGAVYRAQALPFIGRNNTVFQAQGPSVKLL